MWNVRKERRGIRPSARESAFVVREREREKKKEEKIRTSKKARVIRCEHRAAIASIFSKWPLQTEEPYRVYVA